MHDLDHDGVPEFLATHYFTGDKISIYGVDGNGDGTDWSSVVHGEASIRSVDVSTDQGKPFGIKVVDLDGDGRLEILATHHQSDGCAFPANFPGRVYATIPPSDKEALYDASKWTTRILMDGIYPQAYKVVDPHPTINQNKRIAKLEHHTQSATFFDGDSPVAPFDNNNYFFYYNNLQYII